MKHIAAKLDVKVHLIVFKDTAMLFSQTVEYALRAAVHLASSGDAPQTNRQIADCTRVPAGYLSKVLQALGRAGLVRAQRGIHGGFTLSRTAEGITILDVVNAVDPIQRITDCPLGLDAHAANLCPLHHKLDEALAMIEDAFATTTLAEITATPDQSKPLCEMTVGGETAAETG